MNNFTVCEECGSENKADARYCLSCGAKLNAANRPQETARQVGQHWPEQGWTPTPELESKGPRASTGRSLSKEAETASSRRGAGSPYSASSYAGGNYGAMRGIAELCRIISYVFLGVGILGMLVGLITMLDSFLAGFGTIVSAALFAAFNYIIFRLLGESISVIIDIEANTRRTAQLLETWIRQN